MEEKHHIVPRFLLERFADAGRVSMVPREGGDPIAISVARAAKEGGFYALDPDPELEATEGLRTVEEVLSLLEGAANPAIERVARGNFPPGEEDRFHLSLFMAIQLVRGWAARADFEEGIDVAIKSELRPKMPEQLNRWKKGLKRTPSKDQIGRFLSLEGVRMHVNRNWTLGMMLKAAVERIAPSLFCRRWRMYQFDSPALLTSDEPVGLYTRPHRDLYLDPVGPASADAVYFPLDPARCLALLSGSVSETLLDGSATRARAINVSVARGASRWIFHHPGTDPLAGLVIPPRPTIRDERVAMDDQGERIVETRRVYRA